MFYASLFIAITALNGLVAAQNYSTSGPLMIDPNQIPIVLRENWCGAELTSCPQICGGPPAVNNCTATTLDFSCTCTGNKQPNISDYINTIPFFVCEQWITNCVDNNPNNLKAITACRSVVCGSKNSSKLANGASPSASASASPSGGGGGSGGSGGGGAKASSSSSSANFAAAATHFASNYGTHVLAGGMLAAFGLAL